MPLCGLKEPTEWPNSCNLNLYENGCHAVGWHADDEHLFQGKFQDCLIISLSLGSTRRFDLKMQHPPRQMYNLKLASGDLCTMEGMTQRHYKHRVPKEPSDLCPGPRVNLTWRWIKAHERGCPLSSLVETHNMPEEDFNRQPKKQPRHEPPPSLKAPTVRVSPNVLGVEEIERVFTMSAGARAKWLASVLKGVQDGRVATASVYDIVTNPRFLMDVTETIGRRMYRLVHARLNLFSYDERRVLEIEGPLARDYAVTAWEGATTQHVQTVLKHKSMSQAKSPIPAGAETEGVSNTEAPKTSTANETENETLKTKVLLACSAIDVPCVVAIEENSRCPYDENLATPAIPLPLEIKPRSETASTADTIITSSTVAANEISSSALATSFEQLTNKI